MPTKKDDIKKLLFADYLLDTHVLIWAAGEPERLNSKVIDILSNEKNRLYFSSVSIQEIAIKTDLNKPDFSIDAEALTEGLLEAGYTELPMTSRHASGISGLPVMHKNPFDRLLVAQAKAENLNFITNDGIIIKFFSDYINIVECV
ncbi:type II toxin-antitoxin system VapC family toxin [Sodalis ligni]|uniref:PIN domain nuclease of toxin-antitoxin system n=1 Tax=Sodalis ligni TaxID=2697027 RepID=A0A4R1NGT3_9GAMM|nr:type II toxin-antitoxin system VapC family toxin [Sodalis ligni]TCL06189.1 PIN domain nuclease of toxin-antitoxin system [Sodalis ligni]